MSITRRERARAVPDLDQVAEPVARLVAVRFESVVTREGRDRVQAHGELPPAGQGERPGAEAARGPRLLAAWGEGPGGGVTAEADVGCGAGPARRAGEGGEGGGGDRQVQPNGQRDEGRCRAG